MSRRIPAFLALIALFAFVACNATPAAAPALTDPKEILTKSVAAMGEVKSFHLEAKLDGSITADLMGTGTPSAIKLDATSANGDIDIANKKFRLGFAVPALMGINGEVIQVGDTTYTKTSLTGAKFQKSTASTEAPVDTDPAKALEELRKVLDRPEISPTKAADGKCGDNKDCYVVEIDLTAEEIAAMASASPEDLEDFSDGTIKLSISVEKDTLRIGKVVVGVVAGDMGSVNLTVDLSRYDAAVSIDEPAADQVQ
jgi:hypothetical protein